MNGNGGGDPQPVEAPHKDHKKEIILIVVAVVIVALVVVGVILLRKPSPSVEETADSVNQALEGLSQNVIGEEDILSNPVAGKLPETNPVEKANPFKEYKNPFE